ncbi:MAG: hypothetical protein VB111_09605 [Clostridiaceae bacterium]|nr:hypothetical protein [Clostridiaceae bacterium]
MLQAGFSRIDITPPLGTYMQGYYSARRADGILDPLTASCIAFRDGEGNAALVFSLDLIGIEQKEADVARKTISDIAGVPADAVFLACTHTHTGPCMSTKLFPHNPVYNGYCFARLGSCGRAALDDLAPASLLTASGRAEGISFIRRFRMDDGTIRTNPGWKNARVRTPIGTPDETLRLVRIVREGRPEIVIVNFQVHPDVIGGTKWSADFPGFVRKTVEGALPGVHAVYFNGAQGDTNHIDISRSPADADAKTFPVSGYAHSRYMGQVIAAGALAVYGTAQPLEGPDRVTFAVRDLETPANLPDPGQVPRARELVALHEAGRDDLIPETGMGVTTLVAEAYKMVRLAEAGDTLKLHMSAVTAGNLAFAGFPGEPFTDIGRGVRDASPYPVTLACCLTNGSEGYLPMYPAFAEGGYEARSSAFCPGVAEELVAGQAKLLRELHG